MKIRDNLRKHLTDPKHLGQVAIREFVKAWRTGRMIAFVGSYASEEFGYPRWAKLMEGIYQEGESGRSDIATKIRKELVRDGGYHKPVYASVLDSALDTKAERREAKYEQIVRPNDQHDEDFNPAYNQLISHLNINRFITLNYDVEIERNAIDIKKKIDDIIDEFRKKINLRNHDYRTSHYSNAGTRIVSDCFHPERSDHLFDFSIGMAQKTVHVLHLHGRIDRPETLVLTQDDYDRQYRKSGVARLPFEHGLRTLFSGNPILFVGLGMSEEDLLWVLREFVGDGSPSHVAPHFVLWNANSDASKGNVRENTQCRGKVSDADELRRLRIYREFGAHLIFDTELAHFPEGNRPWVDENNGVARLNNSIGYLASSAIQKRSESGLKFQDRTIFQGFRSIAGFLPDENAAQNKNSESWQKKPVIWPVMNGTAKTFRPELTFEEYISSDNKSKQKNTGDTSHHSIPLPQLRDGFPNESIDELSHWLTQMMRKDGAIKAFIDPPGTGHGYMASVIRSFATGPMRNWLLERTTEKEAAPKPELICLQLNASFAWEIDTTFALLSGLYDHRLAFDPKTPDNRCSRPRAMMEWTHNVAMAMGEKGKGKKPVDRNIVVIINGADRFFEKSGYPLSNELDLLLRKIPRLVANPKYFGWKSGENSNVHPLTVVLLGSRRIQRYLDALQLPHANVDDNGRPLLGGPVKQISFYHQRPDDHGRSRNRDDAPQLTKLILANAGEKNCPLSKSDGEWESAYLRSVAQAFNLKENELPKGLQLSLERARGRLGDEQRKGFFAAYLSPQALTQERVGVSIKTCLDALKYMALIGQPIEAETLQSMMSKNLQQTKDLLSKLKRLNLVLQIEPYPDGNGPDRYALHRSLLHEMRDRSSVPISDAQTYTAFNLPLFAAQPVDEHESSPFTQKDIEMLIDGLINSRPDNSNKAALDKFSSRLRAAYASIRSYHTTSALLMHRPQEASGSDFENDNAVLGKYAQRLETLIEEMESLTRLGRKLSRKCVFAEDLVWLHDQRGVTLLSTGDLYEARHALNQAEMINDTLVEMGDHDQNWCRVQLNQLQLDIERGKISHAESRILRLEAAINGRLLEVPNAFEEMIRKYANDQKERVRVVDPVFPSELVLLTGLVCGYKGWSAYIRGRLKTSERFFMQSIQILRNLGEQRAYAHFMRMFASVYVSLGELKEAKNVASLCVAAADSVRQLDISELARTSLAEINLMLDPAIAQGPILQQMIATLGYANSCDMYRVQMETRRAMAKLRMRQGDYDGALEQASEALAIAARFGYSLRKVSLRLMIGHILVLRGDPISGRQMINDAIIAADKIGYQRAVEQAQGILVELESMSR